MQECKRVRLYKQQGSLADAGWIEDVAKASQSEKRGNAAKTTKSPTRMLYRQFYLIFCMKNKILVEANLPQGEIALTAHNPELWVAPEIGLPSHVTDRQVAGP